MSTGSTRNVAVTMLPKDRRNQYTLCLSTKSKGGKREKKRKSRCGHDGSVRLK